MQAISKANHNEPQNKGSYRRRRFVMLMLACFLSWAAVTLWDQVGKISDRKEKVSALEQQQMETQQLNDNLQREIARLNDPEYVEQKIRKELHYVKQGETLFYTPKPPQK